MILGKLETSEILEQLGIEIDRISAVIVDKNRKGNKDASYRCMKFQYKELSKARESINNARMCLLDDFRE